MILLLSYSGDVSIDYVVSWLKSFNHKYVRINADEIISDKLCISINEKEIIYKNISVRIDDIHSIWFRKFGSFSRTNYFCYVKNVVTSDDLQQLAHEYYAILNVFISFFKRKNWLTAPWLASVNKFDILLLAQECGLNIPESHIISQKNQLMNLIKASNKIFISKSAFEPYFIQKENGIFSMFTKEIDNMDNLPDTFFPSFIQEKIFKKYELRVFYINGEFYTMAIFSQRNKITELDFRKYDWSNPNRKVPYMLPFIIKKKLTTMLNILKLNCCSIDILKSSADDKYYFLEINPTGEFGMTSIPCNYEVYKKIALTLIEMDKYENLQ
jgi:ATP-GRASP peptide maturase of grasp-with-spasm system